MHTTAKFHSYNHFHNVLRLFDVLLNFPFTTSEIIISDKHGIHKLPGGLPNDLCFMITGSYEKSPKSQNLLE